MQLQFFKYQGAGNDFILIDNRDGGINLNTEQIHRLCDRHFGIGADGLMLLETSDTSAFKMVYFNSDGNESTLCGNGGRCIVRFAEHLGVAQKEVNFQAIDGVHFARIFPDRIELSMHDVSVIKEEEGSFFLDTGSPHHVVFVEDVAALDVKKLGAEIRYSEKYQKEGVNVNFVEVLEDGLKVRTYERGVEDETLACGTGVTAAAIAAHYCGKTAAMVVPIQAQGGALSVSFKAQNKQYGEVVLSGPAVKVFAGMGWFSCSGNANVEMISEDKTLYIPSGADFETLLDSIRPILIQEEAFVDYAKRKDLDEYVKSGKYVLKAGMTNGEAVGKLRRGEQDQQKLVIKNYRTVYELAGAVGGQIEADSAQILEAILNYEFKEEPKDKEGVKQFFIPNTYFVWWNTSPNDFVGKMYGEYQKFWTEERKAAAKEAGLTPYEVVNLAALVQMEASVSAEEQKKVARAYLNRLKKGMKLEADPTAVYGYSIDHGFSPVYRVYNYHIRYDSPWNTYLNKGLPASPICLPNASAVEAVLDPASHDYVYFCAKADDSGTHHFTNSYAEHERNAAAYRKWLNSRG
ncbi:unnamed protein product, partial [Cyprideis torosa]